MNITADEILDALKQAMQPAPGAPGEFSAKELREKMDWGEERARKAMGRLIADGVIACAGKAHRPSMDGITRWVPVYRLVKRGK